MSNISLPTRSRKNTWRSCGTNLDKRCVVFTVQTVVAVIVLTWCGFQLSNSISCEADNPIWSLVGSIVGFFFGRGTVSDSQDSSSQSELSTPRRTAMPTSPQPIIIKMEGDSSPPSLEPSDDKPKLARSPADSHKLKPSITQSEMEQFL